MDKEKLAKSIRLVQSIASQHNVTVAYSGGKDSQVLLWLVKEAGVKCDVVYNNTTIDPPGTIEWVKKNGARKIDPDKSFLDLVEKKGFPSMFRRFCCSELKERYISDYVFSGVRKSESIRRDKCYSGFDVVRKYKNGVSSQHFMPLVFWTDEDIRDVIEAHSIECHPLYYDKQGRFCVQRRLGCIGCPLQGDRGVSDFIQYPRLLKQVLKRGIRFHLRMGRTIEDAVLNLVYNLFYSNHGYKKFMQTYHGLFPNDPWVLLKEKFNLHKEEFIHF